jgi:2-dehydro-3-deoxyphosphogluconate aldolase/(4S)-4-hydroxy-2-oxoglutarate aldolase
VNTKNLATYLGESIVLAVGGSWLAPRDLIAAENWQAITDRAVEASRIAQDARTR